jgi:prepilin-type N-terminal cleavage/methylation domain-containing protein
VVARLRARLAQEDGMTLIELLTTTAIMGFVLTAIITVFVSGLHAEVDMNNRFQAQQEARLALQTMRTDLRTACTSKVSSQVVANDTVLLGFCSNSSTTWSSTPVSYTTWCARSEGGTPVHYGLYRESGANDPTGCANPLSTTGTREADWLTTNSVFTCVFQSTARPELGVSVPVDANPAKAGGVYKLSDTILLRNAGVGGACT